MSHEKNRRRTSGHAGPHGRTNGHAPASTERGGIPVHGAQAASDDASGASVANAAASTAAGTARNAYAEVAPPHPNGAANGSLAGMPKGEGDKDKIPPGEGPLPLSPGEFVDEIHQRIDLFEVWKDLLESKDDKIKQRAAERLTDLRYKGAAAPTEESQQIIIDIPGPKRD
jgi:hypothetical protein